jgi:hypothetical protein
MTKRRLFTCLAVIVAASSLAANGGVQAPDNKGTDFIIAFPQNGGAGNPPAALTLFIANEGPTDVKLEISAPGFASSEVNVAASSVLSVPINASAQVTAVNAVSSKGIRVRSVDPFDSTQEGPPIAVYAWNRRPFPGAPPNVGDGAYVALPVDVLGTEYRAVSRPGNSQVTVVGTEDNTIVTITKFTTVSNVTTVGTPFQVPLNHLETYLLQQAADLTGTLVTADKPIAVFGGNQNGTVSTSSPDHMVEQMVPVNAWGNEFLIARIAPNTFGDSIVRVLAHEDGTQVRVNGELKATLEAGKVHEFGQSPSSHTWVSTSKPSLVAQYKRGDSSATDPFLMLVPPINQFSRHYLFKTPGVPFSNWLNIVVKEGDEATLLLNGSALPTLAWTSVNGYRYARVPIPAGENRLEHGEPTVRFGAWVYGHALGEGYGYAAGQLVNSPPICFEATPSTSLIWPPNHQLVPITVDGVVDPNGDEVTIRIDSIFQDEPTNDTGDGNTAIDGFGVGTSVAQVRAERSGRGNGRVYHVGFTATDPWDASCSGEVTVGVPHNPGRGRGGVQIGGPVDDGPEYDSTALSQ